MVDSQLQRRRSGLLQERSRQTRQRLVRAALELWTARGFETGIKETTVEEIVQRAGFTKGTFYFHFARKEEILLEMGWDTASVSFAEAKRCEKSDRGLDASLVRVMGVLARHVRAAPPAAVRRAVIEFRKTPLAQLDRSGRVNFIDAFAVVLTRAQEVGEVPPTTDVWEIAQMLQAVVMDSIIDWTVDHSDLAAVLRRRANLLVTGVREPTVSA